MCVLMAEGFAYGLEFTSNTHCALLPVLSNSLPTCIYLTFFNLPRPAATTTATYCVTPQISETAHRTLGLACGFGTVGLQ